jgi:hypothetical protein
MSRLLERPRFADATILPRLVARTPVIARSDCGVAHVPHDAVIDKVICLGAAGFDNARAFAAAADALGLGA